MPMEKLNLRAMEPEDLEVLYKIENDRTLWDVGITNVPYSRYVLHDFISNSTGNIYADGQVRLMIEREGQVIGIVDLVNFDAKNRKAEISIVLEKAYRGHGYAYETLLQLTDYARRTLHLHQLYVVIGADNTPAIQLFKKLGYHESVHLPDWLYDGENYHPAIVMHSLLPSATLAASRTR